MRRILAVLTPLVLVVGVLVGTAAPAHANAVITATSVGTASGGGDTDCANASIAIGIAANTVTTETGQSSNLGGVLDSFSQSSGFSDTTEVYRHYGIGTDGTQPDGTIIASYATIGTDPPTASNTAEWFLLYRCGATTADSVVLSSCFGDYGTCPKTAAEGVAELFGGSVSPNPAPAGSVVTASATGCFYPLGGAVLLNGTTGLGGASVAPNADGTYSIPLTIPAGTPVGTALTVRFDCGTDGASVLSSSVSLTVSAPTPTTVAPTTTAAPSTPAAPVETQPAFTG